MLKNKVIVVIGGAGLIGKTFIRAIVENNGIAVIGDIDENLARETMEVLCQELQTMSIDAVRVDMTDKVSLSSAISRIHEKYKHIDALVNSAYPRNKQYGRSFFDVEYEDFVQNTGLNLGGYFLASQQFAKYFQEQNYGNIVNVSSIYGVVAPNFKIYENTSMTMPVEYAAIKSGLIHITKYMAKYFKGMNIRVNSMSPGGVFDHQDKAFLDAYKDECLNKGMLDKEDLKGTLLYLLSDMSKFVNGQNIIVDDGFVL